jgi:hypothetical protein
MLMRQIVYNCSLAAAIAMIPASPVLAQTTAVGPYYAVPSWDQTIGCTAPANCPRFVVLSNMNNDAVLDRETGLVWEKNPSSADIGAPQVGTTCALRTTGDRKGWRPPTLPELQSLLQPSKSNPALPDGHPFTNIQLGFAAYWTTTPKQSTPGFVFGVRFADGSATAENASTGDARLWCVRGGGGVK